MNASSMASIVAALAVTTWSCGGHVADTSIAPGDRVRITAPSMDLNKSVGTLAALEVDTLVVEIDERDDLGVPVHDVTTLEVHRGQKSLAGRGALIGAGVGAALGAITAVALCAESDCRSNGSDLTGAVAIVFGFGGAALGAGIGALAGSSVKADRWQEVPAGTISVGLSPVTTDGIAVSVVLRL